MTAKEVRFSEDARSRVLRGVNILADAITVTPTLFHGSARMSPIVLSLFAEMVPT
jgi:hypothetical protein